MKTAQLQRKIARKMTNVFHAVSGKQKPTSMMALSLENAQAAYGSRPDVKIHHFVRTSDFVFEPLKHLPEDAFFEGYDLSFPKVPSNYDAVLLEISNPDFSFQHEHLIDDLNRPIYEIYVRFEELAIQHEYTVVPPKLTGTVAYLSNTLFNHYGHWMQRQLPMLLSYWETFGKDNIDYYYVGGDSVANFVEESLLRMGIGRNQIVNYPCRADRSLICIIDRYIDQNTLQREWLDQFSHRFMRENMLKAQPGQHAKKIYVMRGNVKVRRELNLPEVRAALEPLGFLFIDMEGKTMQEQADIFGNADVIVAPHGSALHNTLFSRPGTKVVEIFQYGYFDSSNYNICIYSGCDYYYTIGEMMSPSIVGASIDARNASDIKIDTEKLLRLCREMEIIPHQARATD